MAATGGFSIRISAIDGASKSIDTINKRLMSMQAPMVQLQKRMAKFADVSGLNRVAAGFTHLGRMTANFGRSIAGIIPGMSALTGAATIAGMARLVNNWSDFGTQLLQASQRMGITTSSLHSLQGAARLAGVDAGSLTQSLDQLGNTMQDAIAGRNPQAMRMFNALGIDIRAGAFEARKGGDVFEDLAERLSKLNNRPVIQQQIARQLGIEALLPLIRKGRDGIRQARQEMEQYGVVNEAAARQADEMRAAQTRVGLAFEGLGNSIAQHVGPVLTPLLNDFSKWIAANREWIATKIGEKVKEFGEWLKGIKWEDVRKGAHDLWEKLKAFARTVDELVEKMGGWKTVSLAIAGIWAVSKVMPIVLGIGMVASAISGLVGGLTSLAGLLPSLAGLAPILGPIAVVGAALLGLSQLDQFRRTPEQQQQQRGRMRDRGQMAPGAANIAPAGSESAGRARQAYDYFRSQGWGEDAAAGLVANLERESNFNPNAVHDGGIGFGIAGWNGARLEGLGRFIGRDARSATYDEQLRYMDHELRTTERTAGEALRGAVDALDAGEIVSRRYERPRDAQGEADRRAIMADQYRQRFGAAPPAAAATPVAPVTAPTPGPQSNLNGSASLSIAFANAPAGMSVSTSATGIFDSPPTVSMGMPRFAAA